MAHIAQHVETGGDNNGFWQVRVARSIQWSHVRLRVVRALWKQTPYKQQNSGCIYVRTGTILNACARIERHRRFRVERHLQRELRPLLVSQLQRDGASHIAACGITAESDAVRVDAALHSVLE